MISRLVVLVVWMELENGQTAKFSTYPNRAAVIRGSNGQSWSAYGRVWIQIARTLARDVQDGWPRKERNIRREKKWFWFF